MAIKISYSRLFIFVFLYIAFAKNAYTQANEQNLRKHVEYLASDELEGRLTGAKGEIEASKYIKEQFVKYGLKPGGELGTFYQTFTFTTGYRYGKNNSLKIGNKKFELDKDFYPLAYSKSGNANGTVQNMGFGIINLNEKHNDFEKYKIQNKSIILIDLSLPDGDHPHSKFLDQKDWKKRMMAADKWHPQAIIFYNSKENLGVEAFKKYHNLQTENVILLHVTNEVAEQLKSSKEKISIEVDLQKDEVNGRNVVAMFDNKMPKTIVIGAHYDHLGFGEFGNSLYIGQKKEIHNGADDNASGTSALLELARLIGESEFHTVNYIFIAFSGEELGLLGSNYFTKNYSLPGSQVIAMLNMDMVGRLDSVTHELGINGVGTSPAWKTVMEQTKNPYFKIKTTESGIGASDHTSFYLKNIPSIHFFTGTHADYHKPGDDAEKLNYGGMVEVVNYMYRMIDVIRALPEFPFTKTKDEDARTPRFKVTLGIVPDYFYDGKGLRVDGVSPEKPAEKAGIKPGDVIVQIGEIEVNDMHGYMGALSKFEKGQTVPIKLLRNNSEIILQLTF